MLPRRGAHRTLEVLRESIKSNGRKIPHSSSIEQSTILRESCLCHSESELSECRLAPIALHHAIALCVSRDIFYQCYQCYLCEIKKSAISARSAGQKITLFTIRRFVTLDTAFRCPRYAVSCLSVRRPIYDLATTAERPCYYLP